MALSDAAYPCGHERAGHNTKWVRRGTYPVCLACFRERDKIYRRRKRAGEPGIRAARAQGGDA